MSDYLLIAHTVGVYYNEGPPVPIPNTVVKLISAENTWWETARENRSMPTQKASCFMQEAFFIVCLSVNTTSGSVGKCKKAFALRGEQSEDLKIPVA